MKGLVLNLTGRLGHLSSFWMTMQVLYALLSNFRGTQSHICEAVGLDISEEAIERTKEKVRREEGRMEGRKGRREEENRLACPLHYFPNTLFKKNVYAMGR